MFKLIETCSLLDLSHSFQRIIFLTRQTVPVQKKRLYYVYPAFWCTTVEKLQSIAQVRVPMDKDLFGQIMAEYTSHVPVVLPNVLQGCGYITMKCTGSL